MNNKKSFFRIGLIAAMILLIGPSFMKPEDRSYDELWKQVDAYLQKGLPRSALELIDLVQQKAIKDNNGQQLLKSAVYRFSANQQFEEDHLLGSIAFANTQLGLLQSPEKQLMHSVIAELYWFYYQQNRYRLLNRTPISGSRPEDIKEWDLATIREAIHQHYMKSLGEKDLLLTKNLTDYTDLLILPDKESLQLQPTLYDFLVHRAINFLLAADAGMEQPGPETSFDSDAFFGPVTDFVKLEIDATTSNKALSLNLIQELIYHHYTTKYAEALVYNDLKRLSLVYANYSGAGDKNSLYENALNTLFSKYDEHPVSTDVVYELASFLMRNDAGPMENTEKDENRLMLNEALHLIDKAIAKHPESRGAANCNVLREQILRRELGITVQRVYSPGLAVPAYLTYRNLTSPAFRLVAISTEKLEEIEGIVNREQKTAAILKLEPMKSLQLDLPFEEDYRNHSTVFDLPPLSNGLYLIIASSSPEFGSNDLIEYTSFQISGLSFISSKRDGTNHFYLLERETGKAVRNATISVKSREYDYTSRRYTVKQRLQLKSARDGSFSFGASDNLQTNRAFYVEAETKDDRLLSDNFFDTYSSRRNTRAQTRTWFFTDRAIYRPGQPIYFKGIVLEKQGDDYSVVSGSQRIVRFHDANGQELSQMTLTTNKYGSFEGSFTAPLGALTGEMRISDPNGSVFVSVEEYKRPTFEVKLNKPEGQFRLGDEVHLRGEAMAYAGYPVDSVSFTYRVYREPFFPWRRWWYGIPPFIGERTLLASGESFTHRDGRLELSFIALQDGRNPAGLETAYNFTVEVDVTDRTGETRSASIAVKVANKALVFSTDMPSTVEAGQLSKYKLLAKNLQDEAVKTEANLTLYRIEKADRLLRSPLWELPDRFVLDKDDFMKKFPLDKYDENDNWQHRKRHIVLTKSVTLDGEKQIFEGINLPETDAEYLLLVEAKDSFGEEVVFEQLFTAFSRQSKALPANTTDWFNLSHAEAQPGETVYFTFGSAARQTRFLVEVFAGEKEIMSRWVELGNEKRTIAFKVEEAHRGMLRFQATAVRFNRVLSHSATVKVPHSDKMLDIELVTKREKLNPGAAETWEIIIRGHNSEGVAAELLASMYDASLDQFRPNNWHFDLLSYPSPQRQWGMDNGFRTYRSGSLVRLPMPDRSVSFVRPPQFNWFGFEGGGFGYGFRRSGANVMGMAVESPEAVGLKAVVLDNIEEDAITDDEVVSFTEPETIIAAPAQRTNFNETAFFYPQLRSGEDGSVSISFTLPDALTRWRLMMLAHTKDLKYGMQEYSFTASKNLMIVPNTTRFYREGDTAYVAAKVVNTSDATITGMAWLELFDPISGAKLTHMAGKQYQKPFVNLAPGRSHDVRWRLSIDQASGLLGMRFSASAGGFTDSEEQFVPIIPRKVLVTETMPLTVKGEQTKDFVFENLKQNPDRKNHLYRIDFSANPVWYAVQALPYLQEGHENLNGIFNRLYANALASHIAGSIPNVMRVIEHWKTYSPDAFLSELEKNQELKAILLNETPWVMQSRSQAEQKWNIAMLFDLNKMRYEQQQGIDKLAELQLPNGAWPWFKGMRENRFTTQLVVANYGRLKKMGVVLADESRLQAMVNKAIDYLDDAYYKDYERLLAEDNIKGFSTNPLQLNYLYARSLFDQKPINEKHREMHTFMLDKSVEAWSKMSPGMQAMAAIVLMRNNRQVDALAIMASLRERALHSDEMGTYWRFQNGYHWHQTPVENHVLLIEAFVEFEAPIAEIDAMRTWLLTQKRTTHWPTSRATADAIYALLMEGTDWLSTQPATIMVAGETLPVTDVQAGTGFTSHQWHASEVKPEMAEISITNPNKAVAWGGVYLQYFEDIDKVKGHESPLSVQKELFAKRIVDGKERLVPIKHQKLMIGDEVVVRVLLKVDRAMEFVHLKDERAAAFEPVDVLSGYNWRDGLGYYQSTRDSSTEFFFGYLASGTYVFEYSLRASHSGDFAAGLAKVQSYYAPEFASHSDGMRVVVE